MIAPLVAALADEDVKHRRAAAWLLTHQNAAQHPNCLDQEQLATVFKRLDDEDGFVRKYALELLERFPPQAPEAMTSLVKILIDEHGINSFRAAGILAQQCVGRQPTKILVSVWELPWPWVLLNQFRPGRFRC